MSYLGADAATPLTAADLGGLQYGGADNGDGCCIAPAPADAEMPPAIKLKGRKADRQFAYRDHAGALLGVVQRWESQLDERKEFRPITYWRDASGKVGWKVKTWP